MLPLLFLLSYSFTGFVTLFPDYINTVAYIDTTATSFIVGLPNLCILFFCWTFGYISRDEASLVGFLTFACAFFFSVYSAVVIHFRNFTQRLEEVVEKINDVVRRVPLQKNFGSRSPIPRLARLWITGTVFMLVLFSWTFFVYTPFIEDIASHPSTGWCDELFRVSAFIIKFMLDFFSSVIAMCFASVMETGNISAWRRVGDNYGAFLTTGFTIHLYHYHQFTQILSWRSLFPAIPVGLLMSKSSSKTFDYFELFLILVGALITGMIMYSEILESLPHWLFHFFFPVPLLVLGGCLAQIYQHKVQRMISAFSTIIRPPLITDPKAVRKFRRLYNHFLRMWILFLVLWIVVLYYLAQIPNR